MTRTASRSQGGVAGHTDSDTEDVGGEGKGGSGKGGGGGNLPARAVEARAAYATAAAAAWVFPAYAQCRPSRSAAGSEPAGLRPVAKAQRVGRVRHGWRWGGEETGEARGPRDG